MRQLLPIYYYCVLLLLFCNKGISQENYSFRWYASDNDELPQSSVKSIVQDKYGFIWLSTENGIVRYDGNQFAAFNSATTKLNGSRFTEILGTVKNDSLFCYNEGFKELLLINKRSIQISNNKTLYRNIIKNGETFFLHGGLPSKKTEKIGASFYIKLSNNQNYFINTKEIELCDAKLKCVYKTPYKSKSVFNFFTINNTLYYLNENGEYTCFSQKKLQSGKLNPIFRSNFKLYWNITSNQVFLYSKNKIYLLNSQNNKLSARFITEFKDFESSNIISIFLDSQNRKLYLGSSTNGLCIISFSSFKIVKKNALKTEVYYSSLPFNDSSIITDDGLILNTNKVTDSIPFENSDYGNDRRTMTKDDNGGIWIIRKKKLYCYLKESNYKKNIQYNFQQEIKIIFKDLNNNIWISLQQDDKNIPKLYVLSNKYGKKPKWVLNPKSNINYVAQNEKKILYLGTESGLFKYNIATNQLFITKKTDKLNIRSIFLDKDKKIWITTYEKGFFLYLNNTVYSFPKDKNEYLNSSHCIIEDKKGFFWITTNKGLFQVSKKSLLKYTTDGTTNIYYYYYNKTDGFLTNEFNGGCQPCGNYLENNIISFPSMNGMVFFDPNTIHPLHPNKQLFINNAIVDQKITRFYDTIVLKNNFQRATFFIDYAYYGNPYNLNLEAKLEGINDSLWEKLSTKKRISFTALAPGKYSLVVRKLSDFNSNYQYKKITLIVQAAFYQTIWFKILLYILGITVIMYLSRLRFFYIKAKNKQLEETIADRTQKLAKTITELEISRNNLTQEIIQQKRLIQTISHDITSPLKYLVLTVRNLYEKIDKQDNENLNDEAKSAYISSFQLYRYVENLVKYSKIFIEGKKLEDKSYLLYKLVDSEIQLFEKIALSENTQIINSVNKTKRLKTNSKILSIIIHNLIDNAVKNTKNGTIVLLSKTRDNKLFLSIKDDGKGMNKELVDYYLSLYKDRSSDKLTLRNYGLGMQMIIELIIILKGDIKIISEINKGTTIEIIVDYI
jgi:signal transduction histidine kinase